MPVPLEFLRGVLLVLAIFFAFELGRTVVRVRKRLQRQSRAYAWFFRLLLCLIGLLWRRQVGLQEYISFALIAGALAVGIYLQSRPPKEAEDLSKEIFPEK